MPNQNIPNRLDLDITIIYGIGAYLSGLFGHNTTFWFGHTQEIVRVVRWDGGRHRSIRIQLFALVLNRTMIIKIIGIGKKTE